MRSRRRVLFHVDERQRKRPQRQGANTDRGRQRRCFIGEREGDRNIDAAGGKDTNVVRCVWSRGRIALWRDRRIVVVIRGDVRFYGKPNR